MGTALIVYNCFFTLTRYKRISELSDYLTRIHNGDYHLDVRDYQEGELSILKSEIYKVTLRLVEQNELLLNDKRYLADALSDIAHQLKTPLTSMSVMADLLSSGSLPEEKKIEFTHNIDRQVERMRWLVTSLLKMSKLDAQAVQFKEEVVSIKKLINSSLEPLLIPIDLKNINVVVNGDESADYIGDYSWSTEAVTNIIKNCIEHTQENGTIQIEYTKNNIYSQISIKDNGEGIDDSDIDHIFERFYRGKNSSSDSVGVGLALAKQIIKRQNGSIHVLSTMGKGTTFIIKIYKVTKLSPNMSSESHSNLLI
jgi:signal transduction histidine kinase